MKKFAMMSSVLAAVTLGVSFATPLAVHADVTGGSLWDMVGRTTGDTTPAPAVNDVRYVSNEQILNAIKLARPDAYAKLSQSMINELLLQDQLRQGGTYIKSVSNGYRIYLNSAVVKTLIVAGAVAIAPTFKYLGALVGLSVKTTDLMATAASTTLGWARADRGIWLEYDLYGHLRNSGFQ